MRQMNARRDVPSSPGIYQPLCYVRRLAAQSIGTSLSNVSFDTTQFDPYSWYSAPNVVPDIDGPFLLMAHTYVDAPVAGNKISIFVMKNNVTIAAQAYESNGVSFPVGTGPMYHPGMIIDGTAGDTFQVKMAIIAGTGTLRLCDFMVLRIT